MVWLNGEWKEEGAAGLPVDDGAFLRGEGVFETMLALNGKVFALEKHWERFQAGGERFEMEVPKLASAFSIVKELLARNSFEEGARVRVRATQSRQTLLFTAQESAPLPEKLDLRTTPFRRNEKGSLVGIKAISYSENTVALAQGKKEGAHEVLFANTAGNWCEGAWTNVFAVENGVLLTPPLSSGCLPGVTREIVIALAEEIGAEVREEERSLSSLASLNEFFLTSSLLGVGAVRLFDGRELGEGALTKKLARLLLEREEAL